MVKLVVFEPETEALFAWLRDRRKIPPASSSLARVELMRTARRMAVPRLIDRTSSVLAAMDTMPISDKVIDGACSLGQSALRSLDAIHLASALQLAGALTAFVAYDLRLPDAAESVGLEVAAPA
ncbi:type II toxin-antitoxin system VapC family toxin [Tomitella cavernea]|uniref:Type II toxin-antitoxin system VapC family toxin n=1 Tax=Tomitella cavernea TaxID=1387982 RepID=A0ABP9CJB9_9ACTN